MKKILIGKNCFTAVREFVVKDCPCLESIEIDENSFNNHPGWGDYSGDENDKLNTDHSFHICSCPKLMTLTIKKGSFIDFAGAFEIKGRAFKDLFNRLQQP